VCASLSCWLLLVVYSKGNALDPSSKLIDQLFVSLGSETDPKNKAAKSVTLEDFAKRKLHLESQIIKYDAQSKTEVNFVRATDSLNRKRDLHL
jgi:hypothetical protein